MEDGGWYETRKERERTREEDRETRGKCVTRRKTVKERGRERFANFLDEEKLDYEI